MTAISASAEQEDIWALEEGEVRRPGIVHIVMLALFTGIGIVVGTFGSLAVPLGFVSAFWPGQAVQSIGCDLVWLVGGDCRRAISVDFQLLIRFGPTTGIHCLSPGKHITGDDCRVGLPLL